MVGSDINTAHLKRATKQAQELGTALKFVHESMSDLKYRNEFDYVINMFYSFGFFETDKENDQVLKHFFNALKNGGKFLMHTDVNVPRILSGKYKAEEEREISNNKKLRIIDNYDSLSKRINGAWIIQDENGNEKRKDYSVRVYTKEEFIDKCLRAGFKNCEAYSSWKGDQYSEESEDMIIVAVK